MGTCTITLLFSSITEAQALGLLADLQAHFAGRGVTVTVLYGSNTTGSA